MDHGLVSLPSFFTAHTRFSILSMSEPLTYTPVSDIPATVQELRSIFNTGNSIPHSPISILNRKLLSFNFLIILEIRLDQIIGLQKEATPASD